MSIWAPVPPTSVVSSAHEGLSMRARTRSAGTRVGSGLNQHRC